ncbi:MAG: YaaA family protein [Acholeplasmataceae bacterium]
MIILFSPAKTFKPTNERALSMPVFEDKALDLVKKIKKIPTNHLQKSMHLSDQLTSTVMTYYQTFNKEKKPAIYSYMGQAYKALDVYHFTHNHMKLLSERLYILSALYGILKPLDGISYYRLDFNHHPFDSLYTYWRKPVNDYLRNTHPDDVIINLASKEFSQLIESNHTMVTLEFLTKKNDTFQSLSMHVKTMRGLFLRHLILYDIKTLDAIKDIVIDHYHYAPDHSNNQMFVFIKDDTKK